MNPEDMLDPKALAWVKRGKSLSTFRPRRKIAGSIWRDKITGNKFRIMKNRAWKGPVARGEGDYFLQKGYTYYASITYYRLIKYMEEA